MKICYTIQKKPVLQLFSLLANPILPREQGFSGSKCIYNCCRQTAWGTENTTICLTLKKSSLVYLNVGLNQKWGKEIQDYLQSAYSGTYSGPLVVCFVNATPRWYTLRQKVCYIFPFNIQRELFPPHITKLNQWKMWEKCVRPYPNAWNVLASPICHNSCMPVRSLFCRCLQHISCRRLLIESDGQYKQGKLSGMCVPIFIFFWCKSNKSHTSTHEPFLTYLSLDGIAGLTASLLCDDVLKKPHKATGIRETAYKETGSSFRD